MKLDFAEKTANPEQARSGWAALEAELKRQVAASDPETRDALLAVLGNSDFLARWARRFPEQVARLAASDWRRVWGPEDFFREAEAEGLTAPMLREELLAKLIVLKYRHLFRITLRDLGGIAPFQEVAAEFSALARTVLQIALLWQNTSLGTEFGAPRVLEGREIPFSVLAMGKLGGNELNFSSDLDLIYFYGSDSGISQKLPLSAHEYFTKLAERLTAFLQGKSSSGFLYRIDLELRPEGKAGALTSSIDAMEDYYESFGADWEKQAMIRADWAAGDIALCRDFLQRIHPFVFPKIGDFSYLSRLKKMKEKILDSIRAKSSRTFHVKLGEGGIREIEFFVQAMQMLFGGRIPSLQIANTLEVLPRLQQAGLIAAEEAQALSEAYVFLRTLEHRLQLVEEQQTHQLPENEAELEQLARRMAYRQKEPHEAATCMLEDLERHRGRVQAAFNALLDKRFED
ncbi:MAG TPA: hypothetical protein DF383_01870 [Deltaproteobacteria bacterium]|nr:hypothetical protein [Deltaproteobacteria bacterium]